MEIESNSPEKSYKEKLIRSIKKEVKQIMEEAVTKKFIHEDSASITSLCGSVETCMSHGLKRRALGLFKSSSTSALLHKVAKSYRPAAAIVQIVAEIENCDPNKRSSGSESASRLVLGGKVPLQKRNSVASNTKYLWIRVALVEKQLAKIIDYVVLNSCKYYEKDALVADSEYGSILSSLLVGPCALDYSKLRTIEHLFTDQSADELIQRHRISSGQFPASPPVYKRPALNYKGSGGYSFISDDNQRSKDYVESLHQNNKTTLLYGKNNVLVYLNSNIKEPLANVNNQMAGYLSLHQCGEMLNLKWTPNSLMNGSEATFDKSVFWEHALNLLVHEVVYIHCHQGENSDWIVLVGQDGVQRAPIHFPRGGHLLAFLSCLENGLLPHGMLDPPLWSQKGQGKVFPKLKRKVSRFSSSPGGGPNIQDEVSPTHQKGGSDGGSDGSEDLGGHVESSADFVFRIVYTNFFRSAAKSKRSNARAPLTSSSDFSDGLLTVEELLDEPTICWRTSSSSEGHKPNPPATPRSTPLHSVSTTSSTSSSRSLEQQGSVNDSGEPIQIVCQTMKKQIISRAFYGWLAHCRHLRTIRTHLVGLVQPNIVLVDQVKNAHEGLTEARWKEFQDSGCDDIYEIYKLVYFGGMAHSLRRKLWPLLLAGSLKEDDPHELRREYENKMSEWLAVEAIVRQRDKETMAANLAKLSSEHSESGVSVSSQAIERILEASDSNEVFEENDNSGECSIKETEHVKKIALGKKISGKVESLSNLLMRKTENGTKESEKSTEKTLVVEKIKVNETNGQNTADTDPNTNTVATKDTTSSSDTKAHIIIQQNGDEITEKVECSENHIVNGDGIHELDAIKDLTDDASTSTSQSGKCDQKDTFDVNGIGSSDENGGAQGKVKILEKMDSDSISSDDSRQDAGGGVYTNELLESFALNLHRIEKDVKRCDRNYWYFTEPNLEKLRNIMCTYVWENMEMGYMQGMCDLAAPLLVILDDEAQTYASFRRLMSRMGANFPSGGGAMDAHFANMRSLLQVLDHDLFALIRQNGDYTHFYFCYRWFLLDFKREFCYDDVFLVWESIWAARYVSSPDYVLFLALALLSYYRDIVLANSMDFTDIIKFFNEMAERHNAKVILGIARNLVLKLQTLIENK